jgi:hypothetical protein
MELLEGTTGRIEDGIPVIPRSPTRQSRYGDGASAATKDLGIAEILRLAQDDSPCQISIIT